MIDCHCHLLEQEFDEKTIKDCTNKLKAIISSSPEPNVDVYKKALSLKQKYKNVYVCLGIHPIYALETDEKKLDDCINFIKKNNREIVGIGEVGLDYKNVDEETKKLQKKIFLEFIKLAKELEKPLVVHCRSAFDDCVAMLEKMKNEKVLFHLFSSKKHLSKIIENRWMISIGPLILKSKEIKKIIRAIPFEKIMLETDSPWFPIEKQKFGIPTNVFAVAKKISEIRKVEIEKIEHITEKNSKDFFGIEI